MIIETAGVNFDNKGAELMMQAIIGRIRSWGNDDRPVLNIRCGTAEERKAAGVETLLDLTSSKLPFVQPLVEIFNPLIPSKTWIKSDRVDAIFDASGFAYSDQWGIEWCEMMAGKFRRAKKRKAKVFMLPQAFGPFQKPGMKEAFRKVVDQVDLLFARDEQSLEHVRNCVGEDPRVFLSPDFTNLTAPLYPTTPVPEKSACLIPNLRMVDKVAGSDEQAYLTFFSHCIRGSIEAGLNPFILVHQTHGDGTIAAKLQSMVTTPIDVIAESNPLRIKGIIGQSHIAISSRFHGLVSALSQSVPALATGWSHKYKMLLQDYGCVDRLITIQDSPEKISQKILEITVPEFRDPLVAMLQKASAKEKVAAEKMWNQIETSLRFNQPSL